MERDVTDTLDVSLGRSADLVKSDRGYRPLPDQIDALDQYEEKLTGRKLPVSATMSPSLHRTVHEEMSLLRLAGIAIMLAFGACALKRLAGRTQLCQHEPDHA